ncbi:hypothetical protein M378DRAFT_847082 [Amanita muscaria Koide BX008]|uniref:Protein kinase domain-containing protein n=1 Tax=Amanita muscaria (strain Koide BX008) TaxID=946122 RepID=A0A0C2SF09_AMAMK|nr:hypothetical protein M378DRAFT_847082 [Amanita muscaria Koide BX008]
MWFQLISISPPPKNATLVEWRQSTHPCISQIQQIVFEVAKAIQYVHSLDIIITHRFPKETVFLDSDNHATLNCFSFLPNFLRDGRLEYHSDWTLEANIRSFGLLFYSVLFNQFNADDHEISFEFRPPEPKVPDSVWQLIQWCCVKDPKERPTMDQVVQEMESWISLGQFTFSS